jgi:hypothetical protein
MPRRNKPELETNQKTDALCETRDGTLRVLTREGETIPLAQLTEDPPNHRLTRLIKRRGNPNDSTPPTSA